VLFSHWYPHLESQALLTAPATLKINFQNAATVQEILAAEAQAILWAFSRLNCHLLESKLFSQKTVRDSSVSAPFPME